MPLPPDPLIWIGIGNATWTYDAVPTGSLMFAGDSPQKVLTFEDPIGFLGMLDPASYLYSLLPPDV